jgi:hypothetical protein
MQHEGYLFMVLIEGLSTSIRTGNPHFFKRGVRSDRNFYILSYPENDYPIADELAKQLGMSFAFVLRTLEQLHAEGLLVGLRSK